MICPLCNASTTTPLSHLIIVHFDEPESVLITSAKSISSIDSVQIKQFTFEIRLLNKNPSILKDLKELRSESNFYLNRKKFLPPITQIEILKSELHVFVTKLTEYNVTILADFMTMAIERVKLCAEYITHFALHNPSKEVTKWCFHCEHNIPLSRFKKHKEIFHGEPIWCQICKTFISARQYPWHLLNTHKAEFIEGVISFSVDDVHLINKHGLTKIFNDLRGQRKNNSKRKEYLANQKYQQLQSEIKNIQKEVKTNEFLPSERLDGLLRTFETVVGRELEIESPFEQELFNKIQKTIQGLKQIPSKESFISDCCKNEYTTWNQIDFDKGYLRLRTDKGKIIRLYVKGSLGILNDIKKDYFERLFGQEVYKLRVCNNRFREELSPDVERIKSIVQHKVQTLSSKTIHIGKPKGYSKEQVAAIIHKLDKKNEYIKASASIMGSSDVAIAMVENRSGLREECILFKMVTGNIVHYLWENVHADRAAFLFSILSKSEDDFEQELIDLIGDDIRPKRSVLQDSRLNHLFFTLKKIKISCLRHSYDPSTYQAILSHKIRQHSILLTK